LKEFIVKAIKIHKNEQGLPLYDYSKSFYKNAKTKLEIICGIHGSFFQTPNNHLRNRKCPKCAANTRTIKKYLDTKLFITRALEIHKGKYDYSEVQYKSAHSKIKIKCNKCNSFFNQTPNSHLSLHGCSYCGFNISIAEIKWLDTLGLPNDSNHRCVIITTKNGKLYKVDGFNPTTNTVYEFNGDFWHGNPKIFNANDVNCKNKQTFGELYKRTLQKEEELHNSGYTVVSIWESDFKNYRRKNLSQIQ